jgi:hypothetical protein
MADSTKPSPLPQSLFWLADAPLFIDVAQVERFYDAVVRPGSKEGPTRIETTEENIETLKKKFQIEAGIDVGGLLALLSSALPLPTVNASGEVEKENERSTGKGVSIELHPISTPQRQLEHLTAHYVLSRPERFWFVQHPGNQTDWRDAAEISKVPRALVFLDLPGQDEAIARKSPETRIIPTAAEFSNGKIIPLYPLLLADNGEKPPKYPEKGTPEELRTQRKEYWKWFDAHYNAVRSLIVIEEAASQNGRIQWIDYRLPLTSEGDTLHLHVSPGGAYDTGVLAYNFVKRGLKHGLRLVGTMKSEPDLNVLAVYEK